MSYDELMNAYLKAQEAYLKTQEAYSKTKSEYNELQIKYENVTLENNNLKRIIYGAKREYTPKQEQAVDTQQCSLFAENKTIDEDIKKQVEKNVEEITVYRKKNNKTKKAGIKKSMLKTVDVEVKEYKLNENEKCPVCNSELKVIAKEVVREEITYIPAKLVITNYVQYTYKCQECGGKNSDNASVTFVKTNPPKPLLTHSFASPSLATEVMYQKYYLGVPLYRQEKMWDDKGLILPRGMMANWIIKINQYYLTSLWELMLKKMKVENELLHCDETTIQCNKEPRKKCY